MEKELNFDTVIAGCGVAGLFTALHLPKEQNILMICKEDMESCNSMLAQGGICVLLNDQDYDEYFEDCIRVFAKADEPGTAQLGRLVVRSRLRGLGRVLMEQAEQVAVSQLNAKRLFLTGRRSAREFYEKCGYVRQLPEGYTEENTPYYLFRKNLFNR